MGVKSDGSFIPELFPVDVTDFDDAAPTDLTRPGAFPELDEEDDTTPKRHLCPDCLSPAMPGGALSTTPAEWAQHTGSKACLRGERWAWCARRGKLSLWLAKTG